jgi:hypothetical protein
MGIKLRFDSHEVVPFGKYKGQPIEVLAEDHQYAEWLLAQPWFRDKFPNHYTSIVNNFGEPGETLEQNAMRAEWLEPEFRTAFRSPLFWLGQAGVLIALVFCVCGIVRGWRPSSRWAGGAGGDYLFPFSRSHDRLTQAKCVRFAVAQTKGQFRQLEISCSVVLQSKHLTSQFSKTIQIADATNDLQRMKLIGSCCDFRVLNSGVKCIRYSGSDIWTYQSIRTHGFTSVYRKFVHQIWLPSDGREFHINGRGYYSYLAFHHYIPRGEVPVIPKMNGDNTFIEQIRQFAIWKSQIDRRTFTGLKRLAAIVNALPREYALPYGRYGDDQGGDERQYRNRSVGVIFSCLLCFIAVVLVKYGLRDIYEGPHYRRGLSCLYISAVPLGLGLVVFVYCVFPT